VSLQPDNAASVHEYIAADVAKHSVLVYMKGTPTAPQCGFSNIVCRVLDTYGMQRQRTCTLARRSPDVCAGVKYASRNVLQDAALREGNKTFTCVLRALCAQCASAHASVPTATGRRFRKSSSPASLWVAQTF